MVTEVKIFRRYFFQIRLIIAIPFVFLLSIICISGHGQTLDDYLAKGLANSPFRKEISNQLQSQAIDSLKVLARFKPQVGATAELMYPPAFGRFAYDSAITDGGHYIALIRADQQLFYRNFAKTWLQSVFIQKLATENNLKLAEAELTETITTQYLAAYADFSQLQFQKTIMNLLSGQEKALRVLVENGLYQQTDYLNLTASMTSQAITIKQAFRQYKNDLAILNLVCGIHDTTAVTLTRPDLKIRNTFDMGSSPLMIRFTIDSLKNINEKMLVDLNYKPHLGVFADAGFNATSPKRIPYNLGTSFGMSFSMPIYDGKQRELDYKRISLAEDTRKNNRSFFEIRYQQQKDQLLEQLSLTDDLIIDIKAQLKNLEKLVEIYKTEINRGLVRWLDFLAVINNYTQTRNNLSDTEISRLQIINQLNHLK